MRSVFRVAGLLLGLCLVVAAMDVSQAYAWGEIREATRTLNVRKARDFKSAQVQQLKPGEKVKTDYFKEGWLAVFPVDAVERNEAKAIGYSKASYLRLIGPAEAPESSKTAELQPASDVAIPTSEAEPVESPAPVLITQSESPSMTGETASPRSTLVDSGQGQKVIAEVEQRPEDVKPVPTGSGKPPVHITADKLTYDDKQRTVSFSGNVEAEHEGMQLWAETLTAYFAKTGKPGEEIDRIVAAGGVRMKRQTTEGRSDTVTYFVKDSVLRMEGQPQIQDGKNTVTGRVIKFYVKENRSEVEGGNGKRVEAILFAPETEAP